MRVASEIVSLLLFFLPTALLKFVPASDLSRLVLVCFPLLPRSSFVFALIFCATSPSFQIDALLHNSHPPPPTHGHIFLCAGAIYTAYTRTGGIRPLAPGFAHIGVAPQILVDSGPAGLTASVNTVRGAVSITWRRSAISENAATVTMSVAIPVGATAEIRVPAVGLDAKTLEIFETGTPVWNGASGGYKPGAAGIKGATATADGIIFSVTSGNYQFATKAASAVNPVPRIGKTIQCLCLA